MEKKKDNFLSEIDRRLGIVIKVCRSCEMEFNTLHKEDLYCGMCTVFGKYENPVLKPKGRR